MSHRSKLAWRCRRGMKELDVLLGRYLASRYDTAPEEEKSAFEEALDLPDPQLYAFFTGREVPGDPRIRALVRQILDSAQP